MKKETLEALHGVQKELNVPKSRYNSFARFHYRSCEDILEAVKRALPDGAVVVIDDDIIMVGDRHYVKSTVKFIMSGDVITSSAMAREPLIKKGSDESQITGSASSYARKYALNGLFLIDDAKDVDAQDNSKLEEPVKPIVLSPHKVLASEIMQKKIDPGLVKNVIKELGYEKLSELPVEKFDLLWEKLK